MREFEEKCKEVIVLSHLLRRQDFRPCFVTHFMSKIKELADNLPGAVNVNILQRLQLALLEPLMVHLRTSKNSTEKCLLIECVIQVLRLTPVDGVIAFFELYSLAFFQIFKDGNLPYQPSEELQLAVLECCSYLIKHSTETVLERVYAEESVAKFSVGISVSVGIVKEERSIKLRQAALDFLLTASKYEQCPNFSNKIYDKIADLFMQYLPGILAPLLEVILRDETQHHLITVKALCCWGHILCLVMRDSSQDEHLSESEILKQWLNRNKDSQEETINVTEGLKEKKRTKFWVESAATKLHPLILKISDVRKHSNPKCRLELTGIMINLLRNCARNMKNSLPSIIENLVSSAADQDAQVSQVAEEALNEFEAKCNERNISIFVSVIEENLYGVVNKLPRVVHSGDEKSILTLVKSFSGYIRILGRLGRLEQLVSLSSTLKKLIIVIRVSCELEASPEISNQDYSLWDNEMNSQNWCKPWKRFRHFADHSIETQLEEICHSLGKCGRCEEIFDFLLDTFAQEHASRKELLLITNEVIAGSDGIPDHVVKQLLDFYLEPRNLYVPLEVNGSDCLTQREAQGNIMMVALIMEGIGKLAKNIGNRFQDCLLRSLYYVLERMGSSFPVIRSAATKSATEISNACGFAGDIRTLIRNNVDYLTYHLTIKLKRNEGSVFDVVTVLMKNSPFETMPDIEEIINRVLKSSSENVDSPHTISYLRLFQTFVVCVNKWVKTTDVKPSSNPCPQQNFADGVEGLKKHLESVRAKPEEEMEMEEDGLPDEEPEGEIPEEPREPELPRHVRLTVSVANHSLHFLPSKDKNKKLIVLEILDESIRVLADWENQLLPLVHKIWSPLVTRFDQMKNPLLINRSFTLLCTLSHTAKDFIRSRTLKNVLPALESFLLREAEKSKLKDSSSGYFFTQGFKLQRELLENLGKLASSLRLFERQTNLVAESALPYLSCQQPRQLQEKCRELFQDLKDHDPYLVWFKVHHLAENAEFAKNAQIVLSEIKQFQKYY